MEKAYRLGVLGKRRIHYSNHRFSIEEKPKALEKQAHGQGPLHSA
jgi:hypothetical protein